MSGQPRSRSSVRLSRKRAPIATPSRVAASIGVLVAFLGHASAHEGPTFVLDFEAGFTAEGVDGAPIAPEIEGAPKIADGKFGHALLTGPGAGYLKFPTAAVVSPTTGSVEVWVSPVDWDGADPHFHVFFDARGEGALFLYKYYQGGALMLSCPDERGPFVSAAAPIDGWRPGQWHQLVGTWSAERQRIYVDGVLRGTSTSSLPRAIGGFFRIGDHPWHIPRSSRSLIDAVRIYDRVLTPTEVAAHFAGNFAPRVPLASENEQLTIDIDPDANRVGLRLEFLGTDVRQRDATVAFSVANEAGATIYRASRHFEGTIALAEVMARGLKPGHYAVATTTSVGDRPVATVTGSFDVPNLAWRGNRLGLDKTIPPPWTPISLRIRDNGGVGVSLLGRHYEFDGASLLRQAISADRLLLSSPVTLQLSVAGRPVVWTQPALSVRRNDERQADIVSVARANDGRRLTIRRHIEYDGLVLFDLALDSPQDANNSVDLDVDIPLRSDVALLRHRWAEGGRGLSGRIATTATVSDHGAFVPYVWIGDDDRGLFWFCESAETWPEADSDDAFEIVRNQDTVILRLHLARPDQRLTRHWHFQFGLQATPVKPFPATSQRHRLFPAPHATHEIIWPTPASLKYYGYPEATHRDEFAARIDALHAKHVGAVVYSLLTMISTGSPEFRWFARDWKIPGGDFGSSDVVAYPDGVQAVLPSSTSFADFIVQKNVHFLREFHLDGLYHDDTGVHPCISGASGCGWRDAAGRWHPTYPILAYRNLYRRLYTAVKAAAPNAFLIAHASGNVVAPILAYEDAYLDGEWLKGHVADSYFDALPSDELRAEYTGRPLGIEAFLLPGLTGPPTPQMTQASGSLAALMLLDDIAVWPIWCDPKPLDDAMSALDAFGGERRFVPYYTKDPPARVDDAALMISAYRSGQDLLLVVGNSSRASQTAKVTLAPPINTHDGLSSWPDGAPITPVGPRSFVVTVAPQSYRLVLIGRRARR